MKSDSQLLFGTGTHLFAHHAHDLLHVVSTEGVEHDDLVDAVQELRPEDQLHLIHHIGLHPLVVSGRVLLCHKSETLRINNGLGACVGGHDDNRVPEIHLPALGVGDVAVVQHLQKDVEHIRVGLLDLVKEYHRVGMAAHLLAELSSILVAHIARRGADHFGDAVLFHILGHIHPDHRLLVPEESLRKGLGKLRLSHAGGPQEEKGANRAGGILQAYPSPAYRPGHCGHSLLLAHHSLVEGLLQLLQPGALRLGQPAHRDLGPLGHHCGYVVGSDAHLAAGIFPLEALFLLLQLLLGFLLLLVEKGGLLHIAGADGVLLVPGELLDNLLQLLHVLRHLEALKAHLRTGLVQHVYSLVRQKPVTDVPL